MLALQYAGDLSTHIQDVYDRLEELRYTWTLAQDSDSVLSYLHLVFVVVTVDWVDGHV